MSFSGSIKRSPNILLRLYQLLEAFIAFDSTFISICNQELPEEIHIDFLPASEWNLANLPIIINDTSQIRLQLIAKSLAIYASSGSVMIEITQRRSCNAAGNVNNKFLQIKITHDRGSWVNIKIQLF